MPFASLPAPRRALFGLLLSVSLPLPGRAQPETYRWGNVAMGGGGFVSAVIASPVQKDLFYARTDVGGAYRWNEAARAWMPLTDWVGEDQVGFLGVESIALDPNAPAKVYMLAGISYFNGGKTAILRSGDYGATFEVTEVTSQFKAHGNGMGRQTGERLAVDPNDGKILFCGTRAAGLFRSVDGGAIWSRVASLGAITTPNGNGIDFVLFDKASSPPGQATKTLYLGVSRTGENLYVSKDGGGSWAPIAGRPTDLMPCRAALATDGNLYITYGNGAGPHAHGSLPEPMDKGALWKYAPASGTWTNITPAGSTRAMGGISIDARDPKRLLATTVNTYLQQPWGYGDRIYLSGNGGADWTDLFGSNSVKMSANGIPWIMGQAVHWAGSVAIDPFNPSRALVTSGNGVFMTEDLGAKPSTWAFLAQGIEETVPHDLLTLPGGRLISVIGDYDGFVQPAPGTYAPAGRHAPSMGSSTGLAFAAAKPSFVVRVGGDENGQAFPIYYSENSGDSWTKFATKPGNAGVPHQGSVAVSADGNTVLWSPKGSNSTFRTADRGQTWTAAGGLSIQSAVPVADGVNPLKFYAFNPSSGGFFASIDGGRDFAQASSAGNGGSKLIRAVPGREGEVWVARGSAGLARTLNGGGAFAAVSGVNACRSVGFGAPAPGQAHPAIYIWGKANGGPTGIYRSVDGGAAWTRINDDGHQYGGPGNGEFVIGDANAFGRVYMSTAGRGIVYGETGKVGLERPHGVRGTGSAPRAAGRRLGGQAWRIAFAGIRETGPGGSHVRILDLEGRPSAAYPLSVTRDGSASLEYRGPALAPGLHIAEVRMGRAIARIKLVLPR